MILEIPDTVFCEIMWWIWNVYYKWKIDPVIVRLYSKLYFNNGGNDNNKNDRVGH